MNIIVPEDGNHRITFPDGKPVSEYTIKDGKPHGIHRRWHPNGVLAEERRFRNGLLHGLARQWNARGELLGSCKFENGTGILREWHENGRIKNESSLLRGQLTGRMRIWADDGMLYGQSFFFNGRPISKKGYEEKCLTSPELPRFQEEKTTNTLGNYVRRLRKTKRDEAKAGPSAAQLEEQRWFDEQCKSITKQKDSKELVSWLASKFERELGELSKKQAIATARKLYALGASKVWATNIERDDDGAEYSKSLIIAMPGPAAKRGKIYELCADKARPFIGGTAPAIALGNAYMTVSLM